MNGQELMNVAAIGASVGLGLRWLLSLDVALLWALGIGAGSWLLIPVIRAGLELSIVAGPTADCVLGAMVAVAALGVAQALEAS